MQTLHVFRHVTLQCSCVLNLLAGLRGGREVGVHKSKQERRFLYMWMCAYTDVRIYKGTYVWVYFCVPAYAHVCVCACVTHIYVGARACVCVLFFKVFECKVFF